LGLAGASEDPSRIFASGVVGDEAGTVALFDRVSPTGFRARGRSDPPAEFVERGRDSEVGVGVMAMGEQKERRFMAKASPPQT
jgi:hypothetical protein